MTIAQRIIDKCGGINRTAEIVGRTKSVVYRWTYQKEKGGTGGVVPADAQRAIIAAAKKGLVDVDPSDFFSGGAA